MAIRRLSFAMLFFISLQVFVFCLQGNVLNLYFFSLVASFVDCRINSFKCLDKMKFFQIINLNGYNRMSFDFVHH